MSGAKSAIRISRITMTPPAMATRSRLSRDHAICQSERPWMALPGVDAGDVPGVSTSPSPISTVAGVAGSGPNTIDVLPPPTALAQLHGRAQRFGRAANEPGYAVEPVPPPDRW